MFGTIDPVTDATEAVQIANDSPFGLAASVYTKDQDLAMRVARQIRAGSVAIYCANEAVKDAGIELADYAKHRIGVYPGVTEHGNVETENEVHSLAQYDNDVRYWSHHHNPRTVANNPAGEVVLNLDLRGPAYCLGGACAAGNLGLIHGAQMLQLGEVDLDDPEASAILSRIARAEPDSDLITASPFTWAGRNGSSEVSKSRPRP